MPQLNTTSTADISFILLVFFLVMTSMDIDKGLPRTLPPLADTTAEAAVDVARGNVLQLEITSSGTLTADGKPADIATLRSRVSSFVEASADRSQLMITLDVDRSAPYDSYFNVQNEIVAAYNAMRDRCARKIYGRSYSLCTPEQREKVRKLYPQRITETASGTGKGGEI